MKPYLFLFLAVIFITASRTFYKLAADNESLKILLFVIGISLGFFHALFYTKSVALIELSVANVVFIGGSLICVEIVAVVLFREHLNLQKSIGLVLVLAGLVVTSFDLKTVVMRIVLILSSLFVVASMLIPLVKFVTGGRNSISVDFPIPHHYPIEDDETDL